MTASLLPNGKQYYETSAGAPLVGGKIFTYDAGTTNPRVTYSDAAGTVPNTNPVILDARGEALVFWSGSYKVVLQDSLGNVIWTVDGISDPGLLPTALNTQLRADLASQTDATKGAGLSGYSPTLNYAVGTVGERLNEVITTVGFPSFAAAVAAAANKTLLVIGAYAIVASAIPPSNCDIIITGGASVTTATPDISIIDASGKSKVRVYGPGALTSTAVGGSAGHVAAVRMDNATDCWAMGLEISGFQSAGVGGVSATRCMAAYNYIHDSIGVLQDCAGVAWLGNSTECLTFRNTITNSGWHGVLLQGNSSGPTTITQRCKIEFNDISHVTAYGICHYQIVSAETDAYIINNTISDVSGVNPGGSGGNGIYIQGCGGVICNGNIIRFSSWATSNASLSTGGIGVNNINAALTAPTITNNKIYDVGSTPAGVWNTSAVILAGIQANSCANGMDANGNTIRQSAGLASPCSYVGLFNNGSSHVSFCDNKVTIDTTVNGSVGIFNYADQIATSFNRVEGNEIVGCSFAYIRFDQVGGFTNIRNSVIGNIGSGGAATCAGLLLSACNITAVVGNVMLAGNASQALTLSAATATIGTSNSLLSGNVTSFGTSGVCGASYFDDTNSFGGLASKIQNAGTGCKIKMPLTLTAGAPTPTAGTWAIGDEIVNNIPVVGAPKGLGRATAGTANVIAVDWLTTGAY